MVINMKTMKLGYSRDEVIDYFIHNRDAFPYINGFETIDTYKRGDKIEVIMLIKIDPFTYMPMNDFMEFVDMFISKDGYARVGYHNKNFFIYSDFYTAESLIIGLRAINEDNDTYYYQLSTDLKILHNTFNDKFNS